MVTFRVSEVEEARSALPEIDARTAIEALGGGGEVEAWWRPSGPLAKVGARTYDADFREIELPFHPFVAAVHAAFDQHRPLVLSPDAIWLCIAQGVATHVNVNAETLRGRIVANEGRETIVVRRDHFVRGAQGDDWAGVIGELSDHVGTRAGDLRELVVADFSTTDATSRAVSELALLSAASPYFVYQVHSLCGIPSITLTGTTEDWQSIRSRAAKLADLDLRWWVGALLPILDELCAAAQGRPDIALWRSLYKRNDGSGGPYITGWINTLFPYVVAGGQPVRNDAAITWRAGVDAVLGGGPTLEAVPSGLSRVPFLWKYLGQEIRMELLGGFAGVGQDEATFAVRPELGWAVREAR